MQKLTSFLEKNNIKVRPAITKAEQDKDFYYLKPSEMKAVLKDCELDTTSEVRILVKYINAYLNQYEREKYGEIIGKELEVSKGEREAIVYEQAKKHDIYYGLPTNQKIEEMMASTDHLGFKYLILGFYEGLGAISSANIFNLKPSDIHPDTNEITLPETGETLKFSKRLIDLALQAAEEDTYDDVSGRTLRTRPGYVYRCAEKKSSTYTPTILQNYFQRWLTKNGYPAVKAIEKKGFIDAALAGLDGEKFTVATRHKIEDVLVKYGRKDKPQESLRNILVR